MFLQVSFKAIVIFFHGFVISHKNIFLKGYTHFNKNGYFSK